MSLKTINGSKSIAVFTPFSAMERDIFASPIEPLFNHEFAMETEILQDWLINLAKKNTLFINQAHSKQVC